VKTTIDLDNHLLREAKKRATSEGKPLSAFIDEAMRAKLEASPSANAGYKLACGPSAVGCSLKLGSLESVWATARACSI
jgi:hypothetical protein